MRPSDANCTTVGFAIPLSTTVSRNPLGSTDATAARFGPANAATTATAGTRNDASAATTTRRVVAEHRNSMPIPPTCAAYRAWCPHRTAGRTWRHTVLGSGHGSGTEPLSCAVGDNRWRPPAVSLIAGA